MALAPKNIQQIGNELAIQWSDGGESYLNLELLRRACPCAACGGEPDVLGNVLRPEVSHTDASFQLDSFVVVGGYALQPRWHDGHNTGIYSFQYLRRLASPASVSILCLSQSIAVRRSRSLRRRKSRYAAMSLRPAACARSFASASANSQASSSSFIVEVAWTSVCNLGQYRER